MTNDSVSLMSRPKILVSLATTVGAPSPLAGGRCCTSSLIGRSASVVQRPQPNNRRLVTCCSCVCHRIAAAATVPTGWSVSRETVLPHFSFFFCCQRRFRNNSSGNDEIGRFHRAATSCKLERLHCRRLPASSGRSRDPE